MPDKCVVCFRPEVLCCFIDIGLDGNTRFLLRGIPPSTVSLSLLSILLSRRNS